MRSFFALKALKLNQKGIRKVISGRLWLEVSDFEDRPEEPEGALVRLLSPQGYFLAIGYLNPRSKIVARIISREDSPVNAEFFFRKLKEALELRKRVYPGEQAFRLIHGEGDGLPGLVVDVYGKVAVVEVSTKGMEVLKGFVIEALRRLLSLKAVVVKKEASFAREEGLEEGIEVEGELGGFVEVEMDGIRWLVDPVGGQKTGFYLDQRENRRLIRRFSEGATVLDLFGYTGAFSFYALKAGARRAFCVERSKDALSLSEEIAKLNGLFDRFFPIQAKVEEFLKDAPDADLLILDPPAFVKHKRDLERGKKKYLQLNRLAASALQEGVMFSSSCSMHLKESDLLEVLRHALKGRRSRLLFRCSQAPDHPVNLHHPESFYLKGFVVKVS